MKTLREYQISAVNEFWTAFDTREKIVFAAPTGAGKCLGIGTPVLKYDGSIVPVEQIKKGDLLMGPDSLPRRVLGACRNNGQLYKIYPKKGEPWVCNDVHVLTLVETESGNVIDIPVNEYIGKTKWFKHLHKQFQPENGIDFPDQNDPDLDPYFLGVWVGDGSKRLETTEITKNDKEIKEICEKVASEHGLIVKKRNKENRCDTYAITAGYTGGSENPVTVKLRNLIQNGMISQSVLTSSRKYRIEFFAGIIDTDGYANKGYVEIIQKNKNFANSISFIARSLGFKVINSVKIVNDVEYQRMTFSGNFGPIPTRIARKNISERRQKKVATRTGFSVVDIGHGEYAGFELDGDGRFLLGDFTVTHNTRVAAEIFSSARERHLRCAFVVPFLSLIDQTFDAFVHVGIDQRDISIIQADNPFCDYSKPIQICSADTLVRRKQLPEVDIVIYDEAHRQSKIYDRWMKEYPNIRFLGMSATPWARGMKDIWDRLFTVETTRGLINKGYLCDYKYFAPSSPDLSGVRIVAGDYHEGELGSAMNRPELIADIVKTWLEKGEGRPTLCFCVTREHAREVQYQFLQSGVAAGYCDAFTSVKDRKHLIDQLRIGELKIVVNIGTLTTGLDAPHIACLILARPTKSEMLFVQIAGRGLRTDPSKQNCLILDHSDSGLNLGLPCTIRHEELLPGKVSKEAKAKEREAAKEKSNKPHKCVHCNHLHDRSLIICPNCGHIRKRVSDVVMREGYLSELSLDGSQSASINVSHDLRQDWYSGLLYVAMEKGYSQGWAAHQFKRKFSTWPDGYKKVPRQPSNTVRSWVRSRQIAYAKMKEKQGSNGFYKKT
jgi:superfamily II DNA or RNA helicase